MQRRATDAGIKTKIGNHTFSATGITAYLNNKGTLGGAAHREPRVATDDKALRLATGRDFAR
jgi:hypothetical protein